MKETRQNPADYNSFCVGKLVRGWQLVNNSSSIVQLRVQFGGHQ